MYWPFYLAKDFFSNKQTDELYQYSICSYFVRLLKCSKWIDCFDYKTYWLEKRFTFCLERKIWYWKCCSAKKTSVLNMNLLIFSGVPNGTITLIAKPISLVWEIWYENVLVSENRYLICVVGFRFFHKYFVENKFQNIFPLDNTISIWLEDTFIIWSW